MWIQPVAKKPGKDTDLGTKDINYLTLVSISDFLQFLKCLECYLPQYRLLVFAKGMTNNPTREVAKKIIYLNIRIPLLNLGPST